MILARECGHRAHVQTSPKLLRAGAIDFVETAGEDLPGDAEGESFRSLRAAVRAVTTPARVVMSTRRASRCAAAARLDQVVAGEYLAGGPDRVDAVACRRRAVVAGSLDCPAACAGQMMLDELEQLLVAGGVGRRCGAA
jgi:hypothetical protein